MKKIGFLSILMTILMLVTMIWGTLTFGYKNAADAASPSPFDGRFAREYMGQSIYVIVDKVTGVCYLSHTSNGNGLAVLVDADGTPLTYSEAWYQVFGEDGYAE